MDDAHRDPTSNPSNSENPDNHDSRFAGLERTAELVVRYHEDGLSDAELVELRESLKHNASARELFVRWGLQMQAMAEALSPEYREDEADNPAMAPAVDSEQSYSQLLGELARLEASAEIVTLAPGSVEDAVEEDAEDPASLSARDFIAVGGYLVAKGLRTKVAAYAAVAALIVLGVVLFNPFAGPSNPQGPTAANPQPDEQRAVATLTATHNAKWGQQPGAGLGRGAALYAGDRLMLTHGFAEITTARGAVAILEAPSTIELIDNNELRLHTGKLVGVCETESSKGLLVRTPHMDITDLGTRFGVDASRDDETVLHVFEGAVQAALAGPQTNAQQPRRLLTGQALIGTATALTPSALDLDPFTSALALAPSIDKLRPRFEGDPVVWQGQLPSNLALHQQEADELQVFLERRSLQLKQNVPVDLMPGEAWPPKRGFGKAQVSAGSHVDVYLLHLDPIGEKPGRRIKAQCVIRFDRPIVGVIGAQSTLRATDTSLGVPSAAYPSIQEGKNAPATGGAAGLDPEPYLDAATISEDGRTLTLDIAAAQSLDQVRVLVQSDSGSE